MSGSRILIQYSISRKHYGNFSKSVFIGTEEWNDQGLEVKATAALQNTYDNVHKRFGDSDHIFHSAWLTDEDSYSSQLRLLYLCVCVCVHVPVDELISPKDIDPMHRYVPRQDQRNVSMRYSNQVSFSVADWPLSPNFS